jgi:hypothetical protein
MKDFRQSIRGKGHWLGLIQGGWFFTVKAAHAFIHREISYAYGPAVFWIVRIKGHMCNLDCLAHHLTAGVTAAGVGA